MLLQAENISINYGMRQLLEGVNFYLDAGDKVGIVGINGTGKSTLLKILAGAVQPDEGTVSRDPNVQISYLSQNPAMDENATVLEQVFADFPKEFREVKQYEAVTMLQRLGIADTAQKIATLSGGQRKRVALASALMHPADVLVLDEPTNHLDSDMVTWLEDWLTRFRGSLIMVTHDRYFLENVANHITEVAQSKLYHYDANYSEYLLQKEQRQEMAFASERKRQAVLRLEFAWISRGCRARSTKSRDRIERYNALKEQEAPQLETQMQILETATSRLGRKLIELHGVGKSYGAKRVLQDVSYNLLRTDRIGIVGQNGAGKSTLLRIIAGELQADAGAVEQGSTVRIGHFSQEGRELPLEKRVFDFVQDISTDKKNETLGISAKEMMEKFLFPTEMQSVQIGRLSGGERRRLYLLSILLSAPNVLLLDEPTNDLDITTLAILEEYLQTFPGPVITVSHDRWFLDKLAHQIFEVGTDGTVTFYNGNWSDYNAKRTPVVAVKKEGASAPRPVVQNRPQKLKFSFNEQREFDGIDDAIATAEEALEQTQSALAGCGSDYMKLQELQAKAEEQSAKLDHLMERWVYLNDLHDKIQAQG